MHRLGPVLELGTLVLTLHDDPAREVGNAHRGIGRVHRLAPFPTGPVDIDAEIRLLHLNGGVLIRFRHDIDGGERGVAPLVRIEGRDPDQPVHPFLALEIAVGVRPFHDHGRTLHAGLFPRHQIDHLGGTAALLGPAPVHPQQHLRPIARFGAAGSRVDGEDRVPPVHVAAEQPLDFELAELDFERGDIRGEVVE